MKAVNKGAKEAGGLTIGIIPRQDSQIAEGVDISIMTDMGSGRNNINALSSDVIIACGMSAGTASEVSLALQSRASKPVILLNGTKESNAFFKSLRSELVQIAENPEEAIKLTKKTFAK